MIALDRDEVTFALDPFARPEDVVPLHWVRGDLREDPYCRDCGEKHVAELRAKYPVRADEICLDGGSGMEEEDGLRFCETCGTVLYVTFTDAACDQELRHFEMYGFDVKNRTDALSLRLMIEAQWSYSHGPRVKALAAQAMIQLAFVAGWRSWYRTRAKETP